MSSHYGPPHSMPPPPPPYFGHPGHHYGHPPPPPPPHHGGGFGHHGPPHHGPPHHRHHGPPGHPPGCGCPPGHHGHPGRHGHPGHHGPPPRRPGRSFREEYHDDGSTRVHRIWIERSIESTPQQASAPELDLSHPQKIAHELVLHVSAQVPNPVTVLDVGIDTHEFYASRMLQPRTGSVVGLASDPRVASAFNSHATTEQLAKERMHAVHVPAMSDLSQLNGHAFDVVMCAQPIEQRPDIAAAIPYLAGLLKPHGRLFFASLDLSLRAVQRGEASDATLYRNEQIEDLCAEVGLHDFQTIRIDTYGYLPTEPGVLYILEAARPSPGSSSDVRTVSDRANSPVLV